MHWWHKNSLYNISDNISQYISNIYILVCKGLDMKRQLWT